MTLEDRGIYEQNLLSDHVKRKMIHSTRNFKRPAVAEQGHGLNRWRKSEESTEPYAKIYC